MGIGIEITWLILKVITALVTLILVAGQLGYFISSIRVKLQARKLKLQFERSDLTGPFSDRVLKSAIQNYIPPDCSMTDPSNESDLRHTVDIREPIFNVVDRHFHSEINRKYLLILADSGMGKTSFCLNYLYHNLKRKDLAFAIINLSNSDDFERVNLIKNKIGTVLLIDGLDEDSKIIENFESRISEILMRTREFYQVIITCRSQFFQDNSEIPVDTGVSVITPRKLGAEKNYTVFHLYIMPFNTKQVRSYVNNVFPKYNIFNLNKRRRSFELVERVQELSVRPMLLELLPDLVKENQIISEIYQLYEYMTRQWFEREKNWIPVSVLNIVSKRLSVIIYFQQMNGGGDRISSEQIQAAAKDLNINSALWENLRSRSLLNRDDQGKFKFSHRSIMEFFFVQAALERELKCLDVEWTDLMREIFVSWGHSKSDDDSLATAKLILTSDLSKTGLIPLSSPPDQPGFITNKDVVSVCAETEIDRGYGRSISDHWRLACTTINEVHDFLIVKDFEYDLEWQIPKIQKLSSNGVELSDRSSISELQKIENENSEYRFPSVAEFISLVRLINAAGEMSLLSDRFYYYLSDKFGDREHTLVSIGNTKVGNKYLRAVELDRPISGTGLKLNVFIASVFVNASVFESVSAVGIRVRNKA